MRSREWFWYVLGTAVGLLMSVVDLHSGDPQVPVLFLLIMGAVFGFARGERPWMWAALLVIPIPVMHLVNAWVAIPSPREINGPARLYLAPLAAFFRCAACKSQPTAAGSLASLVAYVPAFLGTWFGAWMARGEAPRQEPHPGLHT